MLNGRAPGLQSEWCVCPKPGLRCSRQQKLVEPLILRATPAPKTTNLTNALEPSARVFQQKFLMAPPFNTVINQQPVFKSKMSGVVGLHPQLLSYDAALGGGINVGWNRVGQTDQVAGVGKTIKWTLSTGKIDRFRRTIAPIPNSVRSICFHPTHCINTSTDSSAR